MARLRSATLLLVVSLIAAAVPAHAQGRSVTVLWDPNPESVVTGYYVYVTRFPLETARFDVGKRTEFTYSNVEAGAGYYFTVAAYTAGGVVGPRSASVFYLVGATTASSPSASQSSLVSPALDPAGTAARVSPARTPGDASSSAVSGNSMICIEGNSSDCYTAREIESTSGTRITALTALGDGRIALVEEGRRVRIVNGPDTAVSDVALSAAPSTDIVGIAGAPDFATSRTIYVSVAETDTHGQRSVSLIRYREVAGVLGQGAAVVVGLPLMSAGPAPFTLDGAGRLYVAMPGTDDEGRRLASVYSASVLRFEPDGSASPANSGGSPVFARGFDRPSALAWNSAARELWVAGADGGSPDALVGISVEQPGSGGAEILWRAGVETSGEVASLAVASQPTSPDGVLVDATSGRLLRLRLESGVVTSARLGFPSTLTPSLATFTAAGEMLVVVRDASSPASGDRILLLAH